MSQKTTPLNSGILRILDFKSICFVGFVHFISPPKRMLLLVLVRMHNCIRRVFWRRFQRLYA